MVPWVGLRFVIVVFPDHTHLLFDACQEKDADQPTHPFSIISIFVFFDCNVLYKACFIQYFIVLASLSGLAD